MDDNDDDLSFPFASRLGGDKPLEAAEGEPPADDGELVAPGDIYATAGGQRLAITLEFIRKDGTSFSVPYGHLPLLWWRPPGTLIIEYLGMFSVMLVGRELEELHRRIKDQRITWVREFDEHQAAALSSAVTRIEIIRSYPSRDAGGE
jgi:hypothetical protein